MSEDERQRIRERLFEELLVKSEAPATETNAIEQELIDFAEAIRTGRAPRVTGADGRDAVAVAELVLERVREHRWDGAEGGRNGAAGHADAAVCGPIARDESWATEDTVVLRRKAG